MFNRYDEGFSWDFMQFINLRNEEALQSKKFKEDSQAHSILCKQIKEALPPDKKELMSRLDESQGAIFASHGDAVYVRGLRDGMKLARLLYLGETDSLFSSEPPEEELTDPDAA